MRTRTALPLGPVTSAHAPHQALFAQSLTFRAAILKSVVLSYRQAPEPSAVCEKGPSPVVPPPNLSVRDKVGGGGVPVDGRVASAARPAIARARRAQAHHRKRDAEHANSPHPS